MKNSRKPNFPPNIMNCDVPKRSTQKRVSPLDAGYFNQINPPHSVSLLRLLAVTKKQYYTPKAETVFGGR